MRYIKTEWKYGMEGGSKSKSQLKGYAIGTVGREIGNKRERRGTEYLFVVVLSQSGLLLAMPAEG